MQTLCSGVHWGNWQTVWSQDGRTQEGDRKDLGQEFHESHQQSFCQ